MSVLQFDHAEKFIQLLTGDVNSLNTWQLFYDPKDGTKRPDLATHFKSMLKQARPAIERAERNLQGVYVCINEIEGKGRYAADVTRIRALFADFDGIAEPTWPLQPHFVTKRDDTHGHAYWLVQDVDVDDFMFLQRRIAMSCGTDTQVTDPSRVVRLPGTAHLKDPQNPQMYRVAVDNNLNGKWTKAQVEQYFTLTPEQQVEYDKWMASREAWKTGAGFDDDNVSIQRTIKFFAEKANPAVEGSGTHELFRVVNYAHDNGVKLETAMDLAWKYYNPRCIPPWQEHERDHFESVIERAYKYAKNEPGCKTAVAAFAEVPEVPPAPASKKPEEIVRIGDRFSREDAAIVSPLMTQKSSHYELAQVLDGTLYDGRKLIRCDKIWYVYNGRSWSICSDDVVKATVQRFWSKFKPNDTLVRGIYNSLSDLVNVKKVENGTWLSTGEQATNMVCFKNGLVDLTDNKPVVQEHTPNFFTFNELDYDYVPGSTCPQWISFLRDIWDFDPQLIDALQEWFGYCMVNDVSFQKFAILIGKSRAGKGVITRMLSNIVGEKNTSAPSLGNLVKDSVLHQMSTCSVALVPDAHSVTSSKRDEVLNNFKAITGNDPLSFHVMYKGSHTAMFKVRLVLSTNNMPEFVDPSGALANRMLPFPFTKSFEGREDPQLDKKLFAEREGVAQWALQGLYRLRSNNKFTEAHSAQSERENLKDDMNPLSSFIDDTCTVDPDAFVISERLYDTYLLWCKQHKVSMPLSHGKLTRVLKASNLPITQTRLRVDGVRHKGFKGLNVIAFPGLDAVPAIQ